MASAGITSPGETVVDSSSESQDCCLWIERQALQGPWMSGTRAGILAELVAIREDLVGLADRLDRLQAQVEGLGVEDFELVDGGSVRGLPAGVAAKAAPTPLTSDRERTSAAEQTGRFFVRCLANLPGGDSGRSRVKLQNRLYVVVRSIRGQVFNPVRVLSRFSEARELVTETGVGSNFGDSIFAGFASQWEAKIAVQEAGLSWPLAQQ